MIEAILAYLRKSSIRENQFLNTTSRQQGGDEQQTARPTSAWDRTECQTLALKGIKVGEEAMHEGRVTWPSVPLLHKVGWWSTWRPPVSWSSVSLNTGTGRPKMHEQSNLLDHAYNIKDDNQKMKTSPWQDQLNCTIELTVVCNCKTLQLAQ